MGASGAVDKSYLCECKKYLEEISKDVFPVKGALSYRNSECGYKNKIDLFPNYNSVEEYIESLNKFIR